MEVIGCATAYDRDLAGASIRFSWLPGDRWPLRRLRV